MPPGMTMSEKTRSKRSPASTRLSASPAFAAVVTVVAELLEAGARDLGDLGVVLDEKRRAVAALRSGFGRGGVPRRDAVGRARQVEGDRRAEARRAHGGRGAAGLRREAVDLAQAEPGALVDLLRREERLENARPHLRPKAGAGGAGGQSGEGAAGPRRGRAARHHAWGRG